MSGIPPTFKNKIPMKETNGVWLPNSEPEDPFAGKTYGTIGVLTAERGTYAQFWNDIQRAHLRMLIEHPRWTMDIRQGVDICGQLNLMIRDLQGDWLWIMGDDHAIDAELLPRLLSHNVDVVVPHCVRRNPPWQPVVNESEDEDGWQVAAVLPEEGLTEVWSAGSAGMLIKRHVLEAIEDPWFTPAPNAIGLNEDINFCRKVREAGFKIYCDPAALLGHISHYTVYPRWDEGTGRWEIEHVYDVHTRTPFRRIDEVPA